MTKKNEEKKLTPWQERREHIKRLLLNPKLVTQCQRMLPRKAHVTVEQILWSAVSVCETPTDRDGKKDWPLFKCTSRSLVQAVIEACEVGLMFGPPYDEAWLIPYADEATFQLAAAGRITLGERAGLTNVQAHVVYEADDYEIKLGQDPRLLHEVTESIDRPHNNVPFSPQKGDWIDVQDGGLGRPIFAYCRWDVGGESHFEVVSEHECALARSVSKQPKGPAYRTWPDEMRKRTAISRAGKRWPRGALPVEGTRADLDQVVSEIVPIETTGEPAGDWGNEPNAQEQAAADILADAKGLPTPGPTAREQLDALEREPAKVMREPGED